MFEGLRTVIYPVTDVQAAKEWYTSVLGFAPYFDEPFYVGFNVGGYELGLDPNGKAGPAGGVAYWGVPDVAAALVHLLSLGATEDTPATEVGGGIVVATVRDPFGNVLGLIYNPHFSLPDS